jgi:uncharacterized protein
LRYAVLGKDIQSLSLVKLTLDQMAMGGIYDQAGGGFSRYSVDDHWKAPHFEKMLYDNAQLISLYAEAYCATKKPEYRQVVAETIAWAEREMRSPEGLFYSALDADSEGVEGKFYTWTETELEHVLGDDMGFCRKYFGVGGAGLWEHGRNILLRKMTDGEFAKEESMTEEAVRHTVHRIKEKLMAIRATRVRPSLDNKCLTSWNAMMISSLADAYKATGEAHYAESALHTADTLLRVLRQSDGNLLHTYTNGQASIGAFLDDYAFVCSALMDLYEISMKEDYLLTARDLCARARDLFFDEQDGLFFFTAVSSELLIARKKDLRDNVIPSSNSIMCNVLFRLSHYLESGDYEKVCEKMLRNMVPLMDYASGFSGWLRTYLGLAFPFHEIVVTGSRSPDMLKEISAHFLPNTVMAASTKDSELPLFAGRPGATDAIYVCTGKTCHAPVHTATEAIELLQ